jgi:hypothetical protein
MTRWTTVLVTATTLGISLLAAGSTPATATPDGATIVLTGGNHGYGPATFTIDGQDVRGLYPGKTKRLRMTIANRERFPLRILTLQGRLISASRRGCPATRSTLTIGAYRGPLPITVRPRSRTTVPGDLSITMARTASPRCSNTGFRIDLHGTAVRAGR